MRTQQEFDQAFPVQVNIPVQWGDMDAFGHVNNAVYFKYFETARLAYFNAVGVMEDMQADQLGPILAETHAQFKRALVFPDQIIAGANVLENHEYGFLMQYGVFSQQQQAITTLGTGRIVMVDYNSGKKVKPTEKLLGLIAQLQQSHESA
ncbi:acyl-CoA thioesterase [Marinicella litoralis]|uniref:Acyl-CoA thioester hydrolase n=1 Tax=Marinicella litoralis TaxID=644220 RepID=A0A4R6Y0T8_9GAMM|nr:acyl-CoA thioesterase [Marinicella litoralis]TDR23743.1 acyl-CoA thioester hydrolase [Marinicella litoralis]